MSSELQIAVFFVAKKIKENRWCFTIAKGIVFVSRVKNSKKGQNSAETNT